MNHGDVITSLLKKLDYPPKEMAEKIKEKKQKPITDFIKKKEEKSKIEKSLCEDEVDAEYWKSLGKKSEFSTIKKR